MVSRILLAAAVGFSLGMTLSMESPSLNTDAPVAVSGTGISEFSIGVASTLPYFSLGLPEAYAQRGVSRRTARRTTRRVNRRQSIAGCSPYRSYYSCGGVYYRPIVENGTTVYVVVNP